ncbi:hypothetical protein CBG50_09885 [Fusobacterium polymorphum]|uniref:Molecular chaperone DnaK n=1 Tax=Fusobacterium nucleatum subsp. polymorphum TaxID=76857 RepID=A0A1Z3CL02_FUSNP|nr:hypothetical protein [Fusobacterium polymorphum]ASC03552.1 hypothetical protein CBG50_09885 [Fusobacterium polymorphum]
MEEKRVWNIQKYKDIEKFRAFNDIRISNIDFLEKFSKLYKIFQKEISNNKTDYIVIKNQDLVYIKGINSIITKEKIVSDNIDEVDNYIKEINEKYKGIKFNILDMREFSFLNEKHILSKGYWWYKSENTYKNSRSINGIGDFKVMGIFKLNESVKQIQKEKIITSNFLILFKIFLELDFIIKTEFEKEFEDLVAQYKKYYKYLSAINYDSKENKIVIIWNKEKLTKDLEVIQNENFKMEIPYNANELGVEREIISLNKKMYYFGNGDREELILGKNYIDSKYYFYNGKMEKRRYVNGVLQGETILKKDTTKLKYYLSIDKERINIDEYQENILLDPNIGHWDLKNEDIEELKKILGKNVYKRKPQKDVNQGGIVGIDFGTKSTVVVYQNDNGNIIPMRIGGRPLNKEVDAKDYENPTVIEFKAIDKFLKDYNEKTGRPYTKWEDITVSHTALSNLFESNSENYNSIMTEIKQWTVNKNDETILVDKKGRRIKLPPYLEKEEDYLDPIELYAYYIGSYINTMRNGIFFKYILSFPVTYEKVIREKILESFRKGIQKSLPIEIQEDKELMKEFKVKHGANEPAAFAVCALTELKIEPRDIKDKVYYGVFDFGGGTTDFDFGIWKFASEEDQEAGYDYELEHFGAGGEKYLGGENIIKDLAYNVFYDNAEKLRKENIQYTRPEGYDELAGEETLVSKTREAKLNTKILAEKLRPIWEENEEQKEPIKCILYDAEGKLNTNLELKVNDEKLKNIIREKIERGIKNFFIKMEHSFRDENVKEINIFLAGNSSKHPYVEEIFKRYQGEMKENIKLNIFNTKIFEEIEGKTNIKPNAKTGVAYGLIYSRDSGNIKVVNRDEQENIGNEINFKFYVGTNRRGKFNCILSPNSIYEKFEFFGVLKTDVFEFYYTTSSEANTNEMPISEAKIKRINLKNEYRLEDRYRIYFKITEVETLEYVIVENEDGIEIKEFIEEGTITLN